MLDSNDCISVLVDSLLKSLFKRLVCKYLLFILFVNKANKNEDAYNRSNHQGNSFSKMLVITANKECVTKKESGMYSKTITDNFFCFMILRHGDNVRLWQEKYLFQLEAD